MIGAQVNQLVLVNNSRQPLILLAGEIVTGGKQDRVIAKDRIVPAESDPMDLNVFCVEPGRWTATSAKFGSHGLCHGAAGGPCQSHGSQRPAAGLGTGETATDRNRRQSGGLSGSASVQATTSYARVMDNAAVKEQVDSVAEPIQRGYQSVIRQLRDRNAVGVVVAVNGEIIWADIFASTNLLEKYWPKLVRSYAAEAIVTARLAPAKSALSPRRNFSNK